jgi:hypothetical protein
MEPIDPDEYDQQISRLIEEGHLIAETNEFGEDVVRMAPTLKDAHPGIYEALSENARELTDVLLEKGLISIGLSLDDEEITEYYYATEDGAAIFGALIYARAARMAEGDLS